MTYAIAHRIPIEARRFATSLTYTLSPIAPGIRRAHLDGKRWCPIGACLRSLGHDIGIPGAADVAEALNLDDEDFPAICEDSRAFIEDWDWGKITDLAEALGVKDQEGS